LYVVIHIRPHPVFTRDHNDLHCEMPIKLSGGKLHTPYNYMDVTRINVVMYSRYTTGYTRSARPTRIFGDGNE
ncbi:MAG: hypothetical protein M3Q32_01280, partial [Pseudomonadota bacterium]|nr:hypothetical protein [Pseudomonadota bacterium]